MKKNVLLASLGVAGLVAVGCASSKPAEKPADAAPAAAAPAAGEEKKPEGSCGADKKHEGSCGGEKKPDAAPPATPK
jgi:hypothetical protein